ncbi:MAG TPA: MFS transporter [Kofleriaceae bacterium]|nr:MFS transporter [Kofleriaceae bacterium]
MAPEGQAGWTSAERRVIWLLWATYGAFYFCRNNISAAVPGIQADLELSKTQIGTILGALKLAYGIGQLLNGQLAERVSPRLLLAIGLFMSAGLNAVFGLGTGLYFLMFVWAANGYFQALGWTPCMRIAANWFAPATRGRAVGLIATGYLIAGGLVAIVAGWAADTFGWRGAHAIPAAILAAIGAFTLLFLRNAPTTTSTPTSTSTTTPAGSFTSNLAHTLANPRLWLLAIALGLVDACRYGFVDWGITHLMEVQGGGVGKNALKFAILPLGGVAGALGAGWMSDRVFRGRRIPVLVGMLLLLGVLTVAYHTAVTSSMTLSLVLLALIGAGIYGPQVLLVGPAAMDLARAGKSAAAVGFVNFFGYLGAFGGDRVTGQLADAYGWHAPVYFWASCAVGAALVVAPLWRHQSPQDTTINDRPGT